MPPRGRPERKAEPRRTLDVGVSPGESPDADKNSTSAASASRPTKTHAQVLLEKKRARDRRAQQKQREKRVSVVSDLQSKNAKLEDELRELRHVCETLYQENQVLHSRQEDIRQSVLSWGRGAQPGTHLRRNGYGQVSSGGFPNLGNNAPSQPVNPGQSMSASMNRPQAPMDFADFVPQQPTLAFGAEPWTLRPAHEATDVLISEHFARILAHPGLVHACPESPNPLELLYGSRNNFLAQLLNQSSQRWPLGDPERLAAGLLTYRFLLWASHPTRARFAQLCDFQKPGVEQLSQSHHLFIDFICWPRLRANMIKHADLYDPVDAVTLLTCCQKVRWPWRKPFLLPNDNGDWHICPEFYSTMTRLDGWGLTDEYIQYLRQYPQLLEGIDVETLRYRFA
ncbi:hypothetical protein B0T10DRAFT_565598 [Thelonectria olida]|uniref:BZIP transcription factor n=1 Tax=Thelonectria olida TaxID=1576542 RepID=A0A9P9AL46_9HYPO|nr:hypothetical protein B0T10DRAFT_565598 [Thelonectria olida]